METKDILKELIQSRGFSDIAKNLGKAIEETEAELKYKADRDLYNAFDIVFQLLIESYDKVGIKKQRIIKRILKSESVENALKIIKWDSENQSVAMKETKKKVNLILSE